MKKTLSFSEGALCALEKMHPILLSTLKVCWMHNNQHDQMRLTRSEVDSIAEQIIEASYDTEDLASALVTYSQTINALAQDNVLLQDVRLSIVLNHLFRPLCDDLHLRKDAHVFTRTIKQALKNKEIPDLFESLFKEYLPLSLFKKAGKFLTRKTSLSKTH